jgi:hypothetical protein
MGESEPYPSQDTHDPVRAYQPEVLPSLLVDVTANAFDIEGDTLLPYFLALHEQNEKRRAERIAKFQQKQMQLAEKIGLNLSPDK